jgi:hypothetical protein
VKVVFCGSRFKHADFLRIARAATLAQSRISNLPSGSEVITGGAIGADSWAEKAALKCGLTSMVIIPNWNRDGKRAGFLRNLAMLDEKPDLVIALWDGESKGTNHTITEAKKRGIPVEVILA